MNLSFQQSGPRSAGTRGTIIFLHGFPFDGAMWSDQLAALPDGWRGIAPDLRGFGRTELNALPGEVSTGTRIGGRIAHPGEPVLTMARLADDVAELVQREVDGPVVVCGLSMGGYVAFSLWRRHPVLIRALILADTRAGADDDEVRENRMRMAQVARRDGARPIAATMVHAVLSPTTRDRHSDVVDRVRAMISATTPETLVAALAGMAARHDASSDLGSISVPTLVVVGEDDSITPLDEAGAMADAIRGARVVAIAHAGHLSNLENPAAFNGALVSFLTEL